jgi:hypothetical protein
MKAATASAINAVGSGIANNSVEVLAGKKTFEQAANDIARSVVTSFLSGGVNEKLMQSKMMPFVEKAFKNVLGKYGRMANEAGVTQKMVDEIKSAAEEFAMDVLTLDILNKGN